MRVRTFAELLFVMAVVLVVPVCMNASPVDQTAAADEQKNPDEEQLADSLEFAGQGEMAFKQGDYAAAAQKWRHALVDDPRNGAIVLLLSQALFQQRQWEEAAGAVQQAAMMLPEDKWGAVVENYKELYGNIQDYTDQLKVLEKARDSKPESPAIRFLLGYHFGYLGYPKQSVRELDKCLKLAPKDEVAKKIRDTMAKKLEVKESKSGETSATQGTEL